MEIEKSKKIKNYRKIKEQRPTRSTNPRQIIKEILHIII